MTVEATAPDVLDIDVGELNAEQLRVRPSEAPRTRRRNSASGTWLAANGVERDYGEAVSWFRRAAEQGNALAQDDLGVMYRDGRGVPEDYEQAVRWVPPGGRARQRRRPETSASCTVPGRGVREDEEEAARWYRRAADQGNPRAQYNLGLAHGSSTAGFQQHGGTARRPTRATPTPQERLDGLR